MNDNNIVSHNLTELQFEWVQYVQLWEIETFHTVCKQATRSACVVLYWESNRKRKKKFRTRKWKRNPESRLCW